MQMTEKAVEPGLAFDEVLHGNVVICAFLLYDERLGILCANHIDVVEQKNWSLGMHILYLNEMISIIGSVSSITMRI